MTDDSSRPTPQEKNAPLLASPSWFRWPRVRGYWVAILLLISGFILGKQCAPNAHEAEPAERSSVEVQDRHEIWTCAMHPQIRSKEPGLCPICGMDLILAGEATSDAKTPDIEYSDRARALMKLRTTRVTRRADESLHVRLLGRVEANERTLKTVTAWSGGRIDQLHVKVTGENVRVGQIIATLYSPEVFAAHQDLLVAKKQVERMRGGVSSALEASQAALAAARERLRLLGVPDDELARMERASRPTRAVPVRSPFRGTIIERFATEGAYVSTGAPMYRVADLRKLWIMLDAYERDLAQLALGQEVRIEVDALPGEEFSGKITFIDPTLDIRRRTTQVRVEVDNKDGRLRPGMFAQGVVQSPGSTKSGAPLMIPASAALFTGQRAVVYVEHEQDNMFQYRPRTVRLGPRTGDTYPVVSGLGEGEVIVTQGAFVLDADLQIRGARSMMMLPDDRTTDRPESRIDVKTALLQPLVPVLQHYLEIQQALASDDVQRATQLAGQLQKSLEASAIKGHNIASAAWYQMLPRWTRATQELERATQIETARAAFEELSDAVETLLVVFGNPMPFELHRAFCPMAFGSRGAQWFQRETAVANAYFGASMQSCGEITATVEEDAHLANPHEEHRESATAEGHKH